MQDLKNDLREQRNIFDNWNMKRHLPFPFWYMRLPQFLVFFSAKSHVITGDIQVWIASPVTLTSLTLVVNANQLYRCYSNMKILLPENYFELILQGESRFRNLMWKTNLNRSWSARAFFNFQQFKSSPVLVYPYHDCNLTFSLTSLNVGYFTLGR